MFVHHFWTQSPVSALCDDNIHDISEKFSFSCYYFNKGEMLNHYYDDYDYGQ